MTRNRTTARHARPSAWAACAIAALACVQARSQAAPDTRSGSDAAQREVLERGRYMVIVGHCNNCHTNGYAATFGAVPEPKWLMGNAVGWRGGQGTVYAPNLRLFLQAMDLDTWLLVARNARPRAPMPWWSLRETSDQDLTAMYRYIRSLQPLGAPAPDFLPPDKVPSPPYNQLPDLSVAR